MTDAIDLLRPIAASEICMLGGFGIYSVEPTCVSVTARPPRAFQIVRLVIATSVADRWLIHDIKVDGRSQFSCEGPILAAELGSVALNFDAISVGADVEIIVQYVGPEADGEVFRALCIGIASRHDGLRSQETLPLYSQVPVPQSWRWDHVVIQLDDRVWQFSARERLFLAGQVISSTSLAHRALVPLVPPRLVSLHVLEPRCPDQERSVLFGIDDATGKLVFEVGEEPGRGAEIHFYARFDPAGYVPTWYDAMVTTK